jgi:hypothetical protein
VSGLRAGFDRIRADLIESEQYPSVISNTRVKWIGSLFALQLSVVRMISMMVVGGSIAGRPLYRGGERDLQVSCVLFTVQAELQLFSHTPHRGTPGLGE